MRNWIFLALLPVLACAPKAPIEPAVVPMANLPPVRPLPSYTPPGPQVSTLANGAQLWVFEDHKLPLVSVRLVMPGGALWDSPDAAGRASLTASMMEESAAGVSTLDRAEKLGVIAADLAVGASRQAITVYLDVGTSHLESGLALMADAIMRPDMRPDDWDRVHRMHVNGLKATREDAPAVAREVASVAYFGLGDPRAQPVDGTPESAQALTLEAVSQWQQTFAKPEGSTFVVVGDVSVDDATAALETAFAGWSGAGVQPVAVKAPATPDSRFVFVDMPGAAQTAIRVVSEGFTAGHDTAAGGDLAGIVLGGSFTSRLNNLLREQKGYTYGASCGFNANSSWGLFVAGTSVRTDATAAALTDLIGVLEGASAPFSQEEATKAQAQYLSRVVAPMESRAGIANTFAGLSADGLATDHLQVQMNKAMGASAGDMLKAAQAWIDPDKAVFVLVGDWSVVGPELESAGFKFTQTAPTP